MKKYLKAEAVEICLKTKPNKIKNFLFKPNVYKPKLGMYEIGLIVNLSTGVYYTANITMEKIWRLIDGKKTIGTIAAKFARACSVAKQKVLPDVTATIKMLSRAGLVECKS